MVTINTILAEALDYIATEIESLHRRRHRLQRRRAEGARGDHHRTTAASSSTATATPTTGRSRPRPAGCRTCAPRSTRCPQLVTDEAMELFGHYGVFNPREMHSRYEIALEQYVLSIGVEARLTLEMATTDRAAGRAALPDRAGDQRRQPHRGRASRSTAPPSTRCRRRSPRCAPGSPGCGRSCRRKASTAPRRRRSTRAGNCSRRWRRCAPPPTSSRRLVADDLWPLATYQEMLFIL